MKPQFFTQILDIGKVQISQIKLVCLKRQGLFDQAK